MGTASTSNYFAVGHYYFNRDNIDIKINYNPNDKSSVWTRYSFIIPDIFDPPALGAAGGGALNGGQPGDATGTVRNSAVGGTYTITPRLLADGNIGYTRQSISAKTWTSTRTGVPTYSRFPAPTDRSTCKAASPFLGQRLHRLRQSERLKPVRVPR